MSRNDLSVLHAAMSCVPVFDSKYSRSASWALLGGRSRPNPDEELVGGDSCSAWRWFIRTQKFWIQWWWKKGCDLWSLIFVNRKFPLFTCTITFGEEKETGTLSLRIDMAGEVRDFCRFHPDVLHAKVSFNQFGICTQCSVAKLILLWAKSKLSQCQAWFRSGCLT